MKRVPFHTLYLITNIDFLPQTRQPKIVKCSVFGNRWSDEVKEKTIKKKYSEEQIATALRQVEADAPITEVAWKMRVREQTYGL